MNHCAVCCNKQHDASSSGCPVPVKTASGSAIACGETQNLDIIAEIQQEFEKKIKQIDAEAGGDCLSGLQAKLHLQEEWIKSLTVQNEMLVDVVKGLETEATKIEKCSNTSQIGSEKLAYLQSDIKNLIEFIRRIRNEGRWNIDGLQFYDVTYQDLFGSSECNICCQDSTSDLEKLERKFKVKFEILENVNGVVTKRPINTEKLLIQYPQESNQNTFSFRYAPE